MRKLLRRLWYLFRQDQLERELSEELQFHLEMKQQELEANGLDAHEAAATAQRAVGNVPLTRNQVRDVWIWPWVQDTVQDVHGTARLLQRHRAFAATVLVTLSLSIGISTVVFSVVDDVLTRPLPYKDPRPLVRLSEYHPGGTPALSRQILSNFTFEEWRRSPRTLESVAAYREREYVVTGRGNAEQVRGTEVSPSLFTVLLVTPAVGRFFEPAEELEGSDAVVVLSHAFWQQRFGANAAAIGRTLTLSGRAHTIVGVAPLGFSFPDQGRQLFTPFVVPRLPETIAERRQLLPLLAVGRLAPGVTTSQAEAEGTAIARGTGPQPLNADVVFGEGGPVTARVEPMIEEIIAGVRPLLTLLAVSAILVLLITCANVANLFLSHGLARERELTLRAAIGASPNRLSRQLLTESVTLALIGGALGVMVAGGLLALLPTLAPRDFPRLDDVRLDWRTLGFAFAVSMVAGVLSNVVSALRATRLNLAASLREGPGGVSASAQSGRIRRGLLGLEVAMAVTLVIGSVLVARSFLHLVTIDTGFTAAKVLTGRISLPGEENLTARWEQLAAAVLPRVQALPGVVAVGVANMSPFEPHTQIVGFGLSGDRPEPIIARALAYVISPGIAEALGLRLREGRWLVSSDTHATVQALVVSEELVNVYLNDGRPVVGRRYTGLLAPGLETEIVGVVASTLKDGVVEPAQPEFYVLLGQQGRVPVGPQMNLVIRTSDEPNGLAEPVREILRAYDPTAAVHTFTRLVDEQAASVAEPRFATVVLGAFTALALTLTSVGLYGMLTYSASRRRREFAVRVVHGANRTDLLVLMLREVFAVTLVGMAVGLTVTVALTPLMRGLLFGVQSLDAVSLLSGPTLLLVVTLVACLGPVRSVTSIHPAEVLRGE